VFADDDDGSSGPNAALDCEPVAPARGGGDDAMSFAICGAVNRGHLQFRGVVMPNTRGPWPERAATTAISESASLPLASLGAPLDGSLWQVAQLLCVKTRLRARCQRRGILLVPDVADELPHLFVRELRRSLLHGRLVVLVGKAATPARVFLSGSRKSASI
jgi:hypothetical protein